MDSQQQAAAITTAATVERENMVLTKCNDRVGKGGDAASSGKGERWRLCRLGCGLFNHSVCVIFGNVRFGSFG